MHSTIRYSLESRRAMGIIRSVVPDLPWETLSVHNAHLQYVTNQCATLVQEHMDGRDEMTYATSERGEMTGT